MMTNYLASTLLTIWLDSDAPLAVDYALSFDIVVEVEVEIGIKVLEGHITFVFLYNTHLPLP